jgi:multidrug efflux pump subunit AcrB
MSLMIVILGVLATFRMPTDIFPEIDIPVVSVIWSYAGISPEEMAEVVTIRCERSFTTSVTDIEHMESQLLPGLSVIKVFFHAGAKVDSAIRTTGRRLPSRVALAAYRHDAALHPVL